MVDITGTKITDLDLDLTKEYLRVDFADDDVLISTMLVSAKSFIQSYLNTKFTEYSTEDEIPDEFTIAALSMIAHWYERREIQGNKDTREELKYVFSGLLDLHVKRGLGGGLL